MMRSIRAATTVLSLATVLFLVPGRASADVWLDWTIQSDFLTAEGVPVYVVDLTLAGGWSGGSSTGINLTLLPRDWVTVRNDLMQRTGAEWASEVSNFAWSSFSDSSTCTPLTPAYPQYGSLFTMVDSTGTGTSISNGSTVARVYLEQVLWDGASAPTRRQDLFSYGVTSGLPASQLLAPSGAVNIAAGEGPGLLSSPYHYVLLAVGGREAVRDSFDFGSVVSGAVDQRSLSIGNFAWENGDELIGEITLGGADAAAFLLESPMGTTDLTISPLDYISGLQLTFNPDGNLAPGEYSAWIQLSFPEGSAGPEGSKYVQLTGTVVPEPSTCLLLAAGMAGFLRRRRPGHL